MVPDKYKSVKLKTKIDDFFIEKICQMGKNVIEIAKLKKFEKNCYIHGKKKCHIGENSEKCQKEKNRQFGKNR